MGTVYAVFLWQAALYGWQKQKKQEVGVWSGVEAKEKPTFVGRLDDSDLTTDPLDLRFRTTTEEVLNIGSFVTTRPQKSGMEKWPLKLAQIRFSAEL